MYKNRSKKTLFNIVRGEFVRGNGRVMHRKRRRNNQHDVFCGERMRDSSQLAYPKRRGGNRKLFQQRKRGERLNMLLIG